MNAAVPEPVTADAYRDEVAQRMTEAQLQASVIRLARHLGFMAYHTHDSRRSAAGFPDIAMINGERLVFAELKSARGRIRPEQRLWLEALRALAVTSRVISVYLWRPADLLDGSVEAALTGRA